MKTFKEQIAIRNKNRGSEWRTDSIKDGTIYNFKTGETLAKAKDIATAERIVSAMNMHEKMLELLKSIKETKDYYAGALMDMPSTGYNSDIEKIESFLEQYENSQYEK